MTDRDRLIERFSPFADGTYNSSGTIIDGTKVDDVVDSLLANGVTVPPCKVGDIVYVIYNNKVTKGKVDSLDVVIEESDTSYVAGVKFFDQIAMIKGFSFGLNVFLTKEEAEEKLRELQNG